MLTAASIFTCGSKNEYTNPASTEQSAKAQAIMNEPETSETAAKDTTEDGTEAPVETDTQVQNTVSETAGKTGTKPVSSSLADKKGETTLEKIARLASLQADVEKDKEACVTDIADPVNPYTVKWNYGAEYDAFTKWLDWETVFDAGYYKSQFPMLAYLFQYNDDLLFEHFRTVGIHEGRQGSENFNVAAYMDTCPSIVKLAFGENYAAYYLYWMTEGRRESSSAKIMDNSKPKQMTAVLTAVQAYELRQINESRRIKQTGVITFDSELAALADFRAWKDATDRFDAHDWLGTDEGKAESDRILDMFYTDYFSENTVKSNSSSTVNWFYWYNGSKTHREAMEAAKNKYIGISNPHLNKDWKTVQFDMFMENLDTALN